MTLFQMVNGSSTMSFQENVSADLNELQSYLLSPVRFRVFFSRTYKAPSSSKQHTLDKFRIVLIEAVHEITHQMENVFNDLENENEQCIPKDGACAKV